MDGVALVTGAGSGLGRRLAHRLGRAGLRVALLGRRRAPLDETAEGLEHALVLPTDVREPDQVAAALDAVLATWGRLDVVVNNAALLADAAEQQADPWTYFACVLRTNVLGPALVTELAVPRMRPGGLVVMIGSTASAIPTPEALAYGASKAALDHLVGSLAKRHVPRRVRVVGLSVGALEHPTDDVHRHDLGATVCETVIFLASPWGRHVHGSVLRIDAGEVVRGYGPDGG